MVKEAYYLANSERILGCKHNVVVGIVVDSLCTRFSLGLVV